MSRAVTVRFSMAEFTETLNRYRQLSKRDPKIICDTKAFFIARRAVLETPKADKAKLQSDLGRVVVRKKKVITRLRTVTRYSRYGLAVAAPLAALIINARRAKAGKPGLYGAGMAEAVRGMLAARMKSIAFLKSAWLPAIRALLPFADTRGAPRQETAPSQVGEPKGWGRPASGTFSTRATIANLASTTRDQKEALRLYGEPALERAFAAEERSMGEYMERKLRETAQKSGVRTG